MFFIVTSLAESWQGVSTAASVTNSYRPNLNDTTMESSIASNNRRLQGNHSETTERQRSSSDLRDPNYTLVNQSHSAQQHNCNTLLNEKPGDRQLQDCGLSDILGTALNSRAHLFSAALRHLPECVKAWRLQMLAGSSNETRVTPTGISQTDTTTDSLYETKAYVDTVRNAVTLAVNISTLELFGSRVRNISTSFLYSREYDKGKIAVKEFGSYLTQLELMVECIKKFNLSLELYNLSTVSELSLINCMFQFGDWELELHNERRRYHEVRDVFVQAEALEIFRRYVDPAAYFVIGAVGLLWNGVLLFIFAVHRELWTSANLMIFNLALVDTLSIILNVLFFYFAHYHIKYFQSNKYGCKVYITLRPLLVAASALSLVALSILRYDASCSSLTAHAREGCRVSKCSRAVLYIVAVWMLAAGLAAPYGLFLDFTAGKCFVYGDGHTAMMVSLSEFVFYCMILSCIMIGLNVVTARNLTESTRKIESAMRRNGQDVIRTRSSKVLTALIVVFLISYTPQHLWRVLYRWLELDIWNVACRCIDKVTYYMLFANSCFNPISLYVVSKRFRKFFNYYFLYLCNHHCNKH
jgi:hypothetical protein